MNTAKEFASGMTFKAVRVDHLFDAAELSKLDEVVAHWNRTVQSGKPWTRKSLLQVVVNIALRAEWKEAEAESQKQTEGTKEDTSLASLPSVQLGRAA